MPLEHYFGILRTAMNTDQLTVDMMLNLNEKAKDLQRLAYVNHWGSWSSGTGKRGSRDRVDGAHEEGLPLEDDIADDVFCQIACEMAAVAEAVLMAMGWQRSDLSPFLGAFSSWESFSRVLSRVLKEETIEEAHQQIQPDSKRRRKAASKEVDLTDAEWAGILHTLAESVVNDKSIENQVADIALEEGKPLSTALPDGFPEDVRPPPDIPAGAALELVASLMALGSRNDFTEVTRGMCAVSKCANNFAPIFKHKGLGNRSTLFSRLKAASCEGEAVIDGTHETYLNLDVVCWDFETSSWGRPVNTFSFVPNKWQVDVFEDGQGRCGSDLGLQLVGEQLALDQRLEDGLPPLRIGREKLPAVHGQAPRPQILQTIR